MERERRATYRAFRRATRSGNGSVSSLDSEKYSLRGLEERFNTEYAAVLESQRQDVWLAVLEEQEAQHERDCYDPEAIRTASQCYSSWSSNLSYDLGVCDAKVEKDGEAEQWMVIQKRVDDRNSDLDSSDERKNSFALPSLRNSRLQNQASIGQPSASMAMIAASQ
eukprot:CAMPEP_0116557334 /NCGR_PEP_ID=MMETSP0397-20121206/9180_1 /TAXON_ID=216820 /ORGANISM="Cyclophora tenuis, Strain ECT3854" /LENGTH=165 /DNA_ID=CAMNT_0004082775 /DNA_START=182 /DNA_END=679 /DNA_ORIENTATION=-